MNLRSETFYPLLKLAIPLMLIGILKASIFFFQVLFLANLGEQILAASALVSFLFATLVMIGFGILNSVSIFISHKYTANDPLGISLVIRDGLLLAVLLAIPTFLFFWYVSPIFLIFGEDQTIVLLANRFFHALAWGLLPSFVMVVFFELIIGLGHGSTIIFFTVLFVTTHIFFSYIFIFGKFGLPAFSIAGAGWGATTSYSVTAMVLLIYFLKNKDYNIYFHKIISASTVEAIISKANPCYLWKLLRVGIPIGAMFSTEAGFFFTLNLIMGSFNRQLLAANQIALQFTNTSLVVVICIAQAITVRMGHLLGERKIHAVKHVNYVGIFISTSIMGLVAICYWFFPQILISVDLDLHDPSNFAIIRDIERLLAVSAIFQIAEAGRYALFGALRAFHDTRFTLLISIIIFWFIALPIGYLLAVWFHLGGAGFWWGMVIGSSVGVILLSLRFKTKVRGLSQNNLNI